MTLTVSIAERRGDFMLEAEFSTDDGVTALFGRSGSGKTTLMRMIAGLDRPRCGLIRFDGQTLLDTQNKSFVPVHQRRFGYVFQEPRLFPHLSVAANLDYGRWFQRRTTTRPDRNAIVDLLGIGHLLTRSTANLSGGEKQRVAIGRALLSSPRLLLMDEPLAALDEARKLEILPYIERLRDEMGIPIIYVSHAVGEVARLADRVIVLDNGKISATGNAADVLSQPAGAAVMERRNAGSLIAGKVLAVEMGEGLTRVGFGSAELLVPDIDVEIGRTVRLYVPAKDVMLAMQKPESISALNVLSADITDIVQCPDGMVDIGLLAGNARLLARITALSRDRLGLSVGQHVFAILKSVALQR